MPPEVIARAFDPFFTTKPTGKGTGLGLSQVYGIIRQAGGEVTIDSKVGHGTKVTLRMPRRRRSRDAKSQGRCRRAGQQRREAAFGRRRCRCARHRRTVLCELGYDVREAGGGQEALAALADFDPDLLIVDFAMPNMNGAEVVATARAQNAGLKILFLSGYADSAILESAVGELRCCRSRSGPASLRPRCEPHLILIKHAVRRSKRQSRAPKKSPSSMRKARAPEREYEIAVASRNSHPILKNDFEPPNGA